MSTLNYIKKYTKKHHSTENLTLLFNQPNILLRST